MGPGAMMVVKYSRSRWYKKKIWFLNREQPSAEEGHF